MALDELVDATQTKTIKIDGSIYSEFGNLIEDNNPLHRDVTYARTKDFRDTPLFGIYLAGHAEQEMESYSDTNGKEYSMGKMSFQFRKPVYPGDTLSWKIEKSQNPDEVCISYSNQDNEGVLTGRVIIGEMSVDFTKGRFIHFSEKRISDWKKGNFYKLFNRLEKERMPNLLIASLIPSALLDFSKKRIGKAEGISRSIEITIYSKPDIGDYITLVYNLGRTRKFGDIYISKFRGVCYKDNNPVLSADLTVGTWDDLS